MRQIFDEIVSFIRTCCIR